MTISGTGLAGVTEVFFGSSPAAIVGTPTGTSVTVTVPAGAAGPVDVFVTGDDGAASVADGYSYLTAPAATSTDRLWRPRSC